MDGVAHLGAKLSLYKVEASCLAVLRAKNQQVELQQLVILCGSNADVLVWRGRLPLQTPPNSNCLRTLS